MNGSVPGIVVFASFQAGFRIFADWTFVDFASPEPLPPAAKSQLLRHGAARDRGRLGKFPPCRWDGDIFAGITRHFVSG
jgi:hypothetical protein